MAQDGTTAPYAALLTPRFPTTTTLKWRMNSGLPRPVPKGTPHPPPGGKVHPRGLAI